VRPDLDQRRSRCVLLCGAVGGCGYVAIGWWVRMILAASS